MSTVLHHYFWCCFRPAPREQDFDGASRGATTSSAVGDITDVNAAFTAITNDEVDSVNNFTKTHVHNESEISSTSWDGPEDTSNAWQVSDFARIDYITPDPVYPNTEFLNMIKPFRQEIKSSGV